MTKLFNNNLIRENISKYQMIFLHNLNSIMSDSKTILELDNLVKDIIETVKNKRHVIFMGVGKNTHLCHKVSASFSSIGIPSYYLDPVHAVHGDFGTLYEGDLIIAVSKSGSTSELSNAICHMKSNSSKFNQKIIGICCVSENSDFHKYCDNVITLGTENELDSLNKVPMVSLVTIQAILDCVGVIVANEFNLSSDEFKLNHPGGTIGKSI